MKICTLGPAGTFSHEAAQSLFTDREIEFANNFDTLFEIVENDNHVGFVPFENSLHGSVHEVLDLFLEHDIKVWRTHDVAIYHTLGATDPTSVTTIASHSQALAQCRKYLKKAYPNAERFSVNSTTYAIDIALADPTIAAIARKSAMEESGLPIVAEDLAEHGNTTRFAVIAKEDPFPDTKRAEMGLVFHLTDDRPGLLQEILKFFADNEVNLSKVESRPMGTGIGNYYFFVHANGTLADAPVRTTIDQLNAIDGCEIIKMLGEW